MKRITAAVVVALLSVMIFLVPEASCAKKKSRAKSSQTQTLKKPDPHSYYKGLTQAQSDEADRVAKEIAENIMNDDRLVLDIHRVRVAARIVARYCQRSDYGPDEKRYYRTHYGVFIARVYTCAGATRALGRVLDFMDYKWEHVNENQWAHQWCVLEMDGKKGFADGMGGIAGYGEHSLENAFSLK